MKMMQNLANQSIAFLDVFISDINNQNLTLQTYHELTYARLLHCFHTGLV